MQYLFAYWPIAASIVAVYILQRTWVEISHRRRAKALGCKPAYRRPGWAPLGIDHVYRAISALIKYDYLTDELAVHNELGRRTTWRQTVFGASFHMTCEPENVQAVLATQFKDFELGPVRYGVFEPLLGRGIFTSDGKDWQHSRALLRPQFARSQISNLHVEEVHVQHLMNRLQRDGRNNDGWTTEVDLAPLFFNLTLDSATEFLFGKSVNTQLLGASSTPGGTLEKPKSGTGKGGASDDEEDWSSFGQRFDRANQAISYRFMLLELYFLYNPRSFQEDCAEVRRFADFYVQRALARSPAAAEEEDGSEYVFLNELVKETRDPYVLRSQLLNILIAGRDTTAGLLGWAMYELARHPDVYERLHASVVAEYGPYSADPASTTPITFETLKANSLLQHVLSETMRLHPSVPGNSRRAVRDTTLPRGGGDDGRSPLYIRAGQEVMYSVNMMHRRTDIWGPDAAEFRPDRWEGRKVGWEFLPFNGGPRICLGQQFALTEAGYVLVRLLQRFDRIENRDPEKGEKTFLNVTSSPVKTLVKLHEA